MKIINNDPINELRADLLKAEFWRFSEDSGGFDIDYDLTAKNLYRMGWRKVATIDAESGDEE